MLELNKVYNMDCIEGMKLLPDNSIDSIVTDPPYEIGFMGKGWDSTGIANNVDMRKECLRVLKPGGHLLSFAATRTYHRMAVAIEDAGFEVRDMIEWVYGSGFPKSLNIGKAVDKLQGNEREISRVRTDGSGNATSENNMYDADHKFVATKVFNETKGTSEWEGWGTALKPAHEPCVLARKPLEGTVANNVLKHGTGGLNIDGTRVGTEQVQTTAHKTLGDGIKYGKSKPFEASEIRTGRFPANLIHDNSEEVRECFPNESERFFKSIIYQAKASKSERDKGCEELEDKFRAGLAGADRDTDEPLDDVSERFRTQPAKNNHPTVKPIALMEYLIKMVTKEGYTVLDPFMGSGTTALACKNINRKFIGFELEKEYVEIANARIKEEQVGLFTM